MHEQLNDSSCDRQGKVSSHFTQFPINFQIIVTPIENVRQFPDSIASIYCPPSTGSVFRNLALCFVSNERSLFLKVLDPSE